MPVSDGLTVLVFVIGQIQVEFADLAGAAVEDIGDFSHDDSRFRIILF